MWAPYSTIAGLLGAPTQQGFELRWYQGGFARQVLQERVIAIAEIIHCHVIYCQGLFGVHFLHNEASVTRYHSIMTYLVEWQLKVRR